MSLSSYLNQTIALIEKTRSAGDSLHAAVSTGARGDENGVAIHTDGAADDAKPDVIRIIDESLSDWVRHWS